MVIALRAKRIYFYFLIEFLFRKKPKSTKTLIVRTMKTEKTSEKPLKRNCDETIYIHVLYTRKHGSERANNRN